MSTASSSGWKAQRRSAGATGAAGAGDPAGAGGAGHRSPFRHHPHPLEGLAYGPLRELCGPCKSVAFVGPDKGTGKSTSLYAFVRAWRGTSIGVTSVGGQQGVGEQHDGQRGLAPRFPATLLVEAGTLVATATACLAAGDITREVVEATGILTPMGEVVIVRALSAGTVELAGPSVTGDLQWLNRLLQRHGAERIFVDGAHSRISPASPAACEGAVLCVRACDTTPHQNRTIATASETIRWLSLPRLADERDRCALVEMAAHNHALPLTEWGEPASSGGEGCRIRAAIVEGGEAWDMQGSHAAPHGGSNGHIDNAACAHASSDPHGAAPLHIHTLKEGGSSQGDQTNPTGLSGVSGLASLAERVGRSAHTIAIFGALTNGMLDAILSAGPPLARPGGWRGLTIAVEDGTRLFLHNSRLDRLHALGIKLCALHEINLLCLCINPTTVDGAVVDGRLLMERLAASLPHPIPMIDPVGGSHVFLP